MKLEFDSFFTPGERRKQTMFCHRWHFSGKNWNYSFSCTSSNFLRCFLILIKVRRSSFRKLSLKNILIHTLNLLNIVHFVVWCWNNPRECKIWNSRASRIAILFCQSPNHGRGTSINLLWQYFVAFCKTQNDIYVYKHWKLL